MRLSLLPVHVFPFFIITVCLVVAQKPLLVGLVVLVEPSGDLGPPDLGLIPILAPTYLLSRLPLVLVSLIRVNPIRSHPSLTSFSG